MKGLNINLFIFEIPLEVGRFRVKVKNLERFILRPFSYEKRYNFSPLHFSFSFYYYFYFFCRLCPKTYFSMQWMWCFTLSYINMSMPTIMNKDAFIVLLLVLNLILFSLFLFCVCKSTSLLFTSLHLLSIVFTCLFFSSLHFHFLFFVYKSTSLLFVSLCLLSLHVYFFSSLHFPFFL